MEQLSLGMDFGFDDDFFNVEEPKKEEKMKEAKKSDAKKADAKKDTAKKSSSKKSKEKEFEVKVPCVVKGRNLEYTLEPENELETSIKVSEAFKRLVNAGLHYLELPQMALQYENDVLYIADTGVQKTENDSLVDLRDSIEEDDEDDYEEVTYNETVTVADGFIQAEFSGDDFEGLELSELSVKQVAEKWTSINPSYEGCDFAFNGKVMYPVGTLLNEKVKNYPLEINVNGTMETVVEAPEDNTYNGVAKVLTGLENARICQVGKVLYVTYSENKNNVYKPNKSNGASVQKVEVKYSLPLTLRVITFNMEYHLTPEMFGGKEKVTQKEIIEIMGERDPMFKDKERTLDFLYNADLNILACMFISGKKGSTDSAASFSDMWEEIHAGKDLKEEKKKEQFLGICLTAPEPFKLAVLPHGIFVGYLSKAARNGSRITSVNFERKLRKIPKEILEEAIDYFRSDIRLEHMVKIFFNKAEDKFYLVKAGGKKSGIRIDYDFGDNKFLLNPDFIQVMDLHSHNRMPAFFSGTDNADECYTGVFGVIGELDKEKPQMLFRAGMEGVYQLVPAEYLFEL